MFFQAGLGDLAVRLTKADVANWHLKFEIAATLLTQRTGNRTRWMWFRDRW
jgi:hypothetical protein